MVKTLDLTGEVLESLDELERKLLLEMDTALKDLANYLSSLTIDHCMLVDCGGELTEGERKLAGCSRWKSLALPPDLDARMLSVGKNLGKIAHIDAVGRWFDHITEQRKGLTVRRFNPIVVLKI